MLAARRYSSRSRLAVACLGALILNGCAGKAPSVLSQSGATKTELMQAVEPRATSQAGAAAIRIEAASRQEEVLKPREELAWCRYLDAQANAKNALLLSPTLSASIDDDQKASAKISYDFMDIARAKLEKKSAAAACSRYYAADRITRMLFSTPQSLTYAGNLEKANYLQSKRGELTALARRINHHVEKGEMTAQLAAGLVQYIETIKSEEYHARAEAHRRE